MLLLSPIRVGKLKLFFFFGKSTRLARELRNDAAGLPGENESTRTKTLVLIPYKIPYTL